MNRITKLLVLFMAAVLLLSCFAACDKKEPPEQETQSESASDTTKEDWAPNFKGETLSILGWKSGNITEYVEELTETSSIVDKAVYDRCDYAETRLNVKTTWEIMENSGFIDTADRGNSTGGKYDMIFNTSTYSQTLMTRGVLSNLKQYPYLDFEADGWAKSLLNDVTIKNKLYFATGDISTNLIFMTSVVFFNKDLVKTLGINEKIQENYGEEDLYSLVTEGKWTLDKMITLSSDVYLDLTKDGKKNEGDRFGCNTYLQLLENFYYGGGYTVIKADGDEFSFSDEYMTPDLVGNLLEQVNDFLHDTDDGFIEADFTATSKSFADGRVLFSMAPASHAYHTHSNTEDLNYSVLPIPKHSETQERYACTQSFPYAMYSIASQSKKATPTSAFMQVLAEESYNLTRPALFDKVMKGRYAEDPVDAEMWEYAVDANVFDVGRVFQNYFQPEGGEKTSLTVGLFRARITADNDNWSGVLGSYAVAMATCISDFADAIAALPD